MQTGQQCSLLLSRDLQELTEFGTPMFPCVAFDEDFDEWYVGGVLPWHWHRELEFIYVHEGAMRIVCGGETHLVERGEAVFVNANVLHRAQRAEHAQVCRIHSFVFAPELIGGLPQSVIQQAYLRPLLASEAVASLHLHGAAAWEREAIASLCAAYCAYTGDFAGNVMLVQAELTRLLFFIVKHCAPGLPQRRPVQNRDAERVKRMLSFLHEHYAEPLNVARIAAAASVSASECNRCFQKALDTTPMEYLNAFRLRVAAELLLHSDRSVAEICTVSGFNGQSYFAKQFRKAMHCSPREYRRARGV